MDGRAASIKLRTVLSELYPDEISARRVMYDAGLNPGRINFSTGAVNFWQDIVSEANRNDKLSDLMLVVRNDYGVNKELQQILGAYQTSRPGKSVRNVASEELYPSQRGCYLRMGQVSASVVIMLFFIVLLANFQVIRQALSELMYPNLTPIPTVETIPLLTATPLPAHTSTPQPTITITGTLWNCEENVYNCSDFASQNESQEIYDFCLQSVGQDIHKLDPDKDGVACESTSADVKPTLATCEGDLYNCSDFASQNESQEIFDQCMTLVGLDIHKLDPDKDGVACESTSASVEPAVITTVVLSQTLSETSTLMP